MAGRGTSSTILLIVGIPWAGCVHITFPPALQINNPDVLGTRPFWAVFGNDFWGASLTATASHKSYRPLTTITFRLNFYFSQFMPMGYHFINILLHAMTCVLVFLFARQEESRGLQRADDEMWPL